MNPLRRLAVLWVLAVALLACSTVRATETLYFFHTDAAGSVVATSDNNGNVLWREAYRPYGERTKNPAAATQFRNFFHGKMYEVESGLSYFGARYYDPLVGRFMGVDPQGFDEANLHSSNRFAYGNNNPVRYRDPNGKWAEDIALAVPSLIAGALSFRKNFSEGNTTASIVDMLGMAGDAIAAAAPGVPGGFGLAIAATRKVGSQATETSVVAKEILERKTLGVDGAKSVQIIEREGGTTISRTHVVTKDGKVVHQHQNHTGKHGGERQFPTEWTGTEHIKAPHENFPPSFPADRVSGGRTF